MFRLLLPYDNNGHYRLIIKQKEMGDKDEDVLNSEQFRRAMADILGERLVLHWEMMRTSALYKASHDCMHDKLKSVVDTFLPPEYGICIPSMELYVEKSAPTPEAAALTASILKAAKKAAAPHVAALTAVVAEGTLKETDVLLSALIAASAAAEATPILTTTPSEAVKAAQQLDSALWTAILASAAATPAAIEAAAVALVEIVTSHAPLLQQYPSQTTPTTTPVAAAEAATTQAEEDAAADAATTPSLKVFTNALQMAQYAVGVRASKGTPREAAATEKFASATAATPTAVEEATAALVAVVTGVTSAQSSPPPPSPPPPSPSPMVTSVTTAPSSTAPVTITTTVATTAADTETKGTSFLKPATTAKRRPRKKLSLKISHQEQLIARIDRTPDVSSAQSVLEQWWEQTPREPTYSPNAPVMMTTGDSDDHEAFKLATLPSMDLDALPLLDASWSPASPEDVFSSGIPMVCNDDNVDQDPYEEARLTPLQRECSACRHNNMLRYISCNSGQVMCHVCFREAIDCTYFTDGPLTCVGPVWDSMMEDHILC
ncbi:mucin-5AC-like [Haliotis rufescens]|uniref:mucin-5AC-like n=1 Tax=Haliotis rufescens TaxID=6454 RepID=UPI00201F0BA8|nr:mucin-5AC-like [Haliotis rufescens]